MHKQTIASLIGGAAGAGLMALAMFTLSAIAAPTQAPPEGNPTFPLSGSAGSVGPAGPAGPTGPQGPPGPPGSGGPVAEYRLNDYSYGTGSYRCTLVGLDEWCADGDGCTIRVMMDHKLAADDEFRIIDQHIGFENYSPGFDNTAGLTGWTRQSGGGDYKWISGGGNYTVFAPWDWAWMLTYRHPNCYGYTQSLQAGSFTFMTHPHIFSRFLIYD